MLGSRITVDIHVLRRQFYLHPVTSAPYLDEDRCSALMDLLVVNRTTLFCYRAAGNHVCCYLRLREEEESL